MKSASVKGPMTKAEMQEEMLRMRAEAMVREMFEKTPAFERYVKRAMAEMKVMERDMADGREGVSDDARTSIVGPPIAKVTYESPLIRFDYPRGTAAEVGASFRMPRLPRDVLILRRHGSEVLRIPWPDGLTLDEALLAWARSVPRDGA